MANSAGNQCCENCGCAGEANAHEVDLHERLLESCSLEGVVACPVCGANEVTANYDQDYKQYYYTLLRRRAWIFRTLEIHISCTKCEYRKVIEHEVPIVRRLYRVIVRGDVKSDFLKRI